MVYSDRFVACIKVNNKILRERKENDGTVVYLPFGSEYSILLKNLDNRRAVVNIDIDGRDVTNGGLVIPGNSEVDLERFVTLDSKGYKFKFIEKTAQISEYRGDKPDDGVIRIQYQFEEIPEPIKITLPKIEKHHHHHYYPKPEPWHPRPYSPFDDPYRPILYGSSLRSADGVKATCCNNPSPMGERLRGMSSDVSEYSVSCSVDNSENVSVNYLADIGSHQPISQDGITVEGSDSNQQFHSVNVGKLTTAKVITIKLLGANEEQVEITKPVTVTSKIRCKVCGNKCKSSDVYCPKCSARVIL